MEIENKYLNIIGLHIYNTQLDKYGIISNLNISKNADNSFGISYIAFYDSKDNNSTLFYQDFLNNKVKFILIEFDYLDNKEYNEHCLESIKEYLGDNFNLNNIIRINEKDRQKKLEQQEIKEILNINTNLNKFNFIISETIFQNYHLMKLYKLFTENLITENQMLYGFINVIFAENLFLKENYELKNSF